MSSGKGMVEAYLVLGRVPQIGDGLLPLSSRGRQKHL